MRVVSLFSGCGGLDLGFEKAGFDIIWANDFDKYAVETYKKNFSNTIVCGDINNIKLSQIPEHDVLIGGFPCQPFSMMGAERGFEDTRGTLFFRIAEIIKYQGEHGHKPQAIILENVRTLKTHDNGKTFSVIKKTLEDLGYRVFVSLLNSADYGVPQTRNRTYIVCFLDHSIEYEFPIKKQLNYTMQDKLEKDVDEKYFLSDRILKTILSEGTKNYKAKAEIDLKVARPLTATMAKMHRASQDNYVTQNGRIRRLTPRECARLQGFPETFKFDVSDNQAYKQFGNAVTVNVSYAVACSVKAKLVQGQERNTVEPLTQQMSNELNEMVNLLKILPENNDDSIDIRLCYERIFEGSSDKRLQSRTNDWMKSEGIITDMLSPYLSKLCRICNKKKYCKICTISKYCNHFINCRHIETENNTLPTFVDLFCGSGGLSLGFLHEGYALSLANDIEPSCIETYIFNHVDTPSEHIICDDIDNVIEKVIQLRRYNNTDVVVGGPPCQGFSMANRQRVIDDPRNHLYKSYINAVDKLQPRFVVMENVKGMLNVQEQIKEDFSKIGFNIAAGILNASDFGIPQNRERVIFIGNRIGVDNEKIFERIFEESKNAKRFVLKDALFGLRELKAKTVPNTTKSDSEESGYLIEENIFEETNSYLDMLNDGMRVQVVFNHKARYNNPRDVEIFGRLEQGDRSDDPKIADIMPYANRAGIFKDKYFKLDENKPCKTITAHMKFDCNMYIHPLQARGLTPREAARVQSYPDDYYFKGPYTKTYMQVGNSVPPLLSRVIAHVLKEFI